VRFGHDVHGECVHACLQCAWVHAAGAHAQLWACVVEQCTPLDTQHSFIACSRCACMQGVLGSVCSCRGGGCSVLAAGVHAWAQGVDDPS
jgi:hypothetical protein